MQKWSTSSSKIIDYFIYFFDEKMNLFMKQTIKTVKSVSKSCNTKQQKQSKQETK